MSDLRVKKKTIEILDQTGGWIYFEDKLWAPYLKNDSAMSILNV